MEPVSEPTPNKQIDLRILRNICKSSECKWSVLSQSVMNFEPGLRIKVELLDLTQGHLLIVILLIQLILL